MNKIEKQIINTKRQVWQEEKKAEFKALFPDVIELDEDGNILETFSESFGSWLNELESYEVTTTDEDGNEVINTYSRKIRPMPSFMVTEADLEAKAKENYAELRARAYPKMEDQMDMLYKDMLDGGTRFKDAVTVVKNTYPKL